MMNLVSFAVVSIIVILIGTALTVGVGTLAVAGMSVSTISQAIVLILVVSVPSLLLYSLYQLKESRERISCLEGKVKDLVELVNHLSASAQAESGVYTNDK